MNVLNVYWVDEWKSWQVIRPYANEGEYFHYKADALREAKEREPNFIRVHDKQNNLLYVLERKYEKFIKIN